MITRIIGTLAVLLLANANAEGAPITFEFIGSGAIEFSFLYTIDSETPDVNPDPRFGEYRGGTAIFRIGDVSLVSEPLTTIIGDGGVTHDGQPFPDRYVIEGRGVLPAHVARLGGTEFLWFLQWFTDGPPEWFDSDALPLTPPLIMRQPADGEFFLSELVPNCGPCPGAFRAAGGIREIRAVPEPSSLLLLLLGVLLFGGGFGRVIAGASGSH